MTFQIQMVKRSKCSIQIRWIDWWFTGPRHLLIALPYCAMVMQRVK